MKLTTTLVLLLLVTAFSFADSLAADFTEKDLNGKTVSLHDLRGTVVMLNFWGPWCQPCRTEVPTLEKLQDKYRGKLVIIGAAVFSAEQAIELFYRDFSMNYPVIYGSYDLMDKYGKISAFPTTILIDRKGMIAGTFVGSRTKEQFEEALKPLLAQ
jgi:thiol-disulfide isomerase/thioredoxin